MNRREFLLTTGLAAAALQPAHSADVSENQSDDPLGVRADFPITREYAYLNTAYTSAVPIQAAEAGIEFTRAKAYRPDSLPDMMAGVERAREKFAAMLGVSGDEIGFLFATSEGENIVTHALEFKAGDNIVVDELHYTTTYVLYRQLEQTAGVELRIVPTHGGAALLEDFERLTDDRTRLISVSWVSHDNGYRHDVKALAEIAHAHGAYIYVDAIQAVGMFPMNLREQGIDFLASGSYKWLHASYNAAGFYVRNELLDLIPPDRAGYLHVRKLPGQHFRYELDRTARKYEFASPAFTGIYQLERAIDYLTGVGLDRIESHVVTLANYLNRELRNLGYEVLTPEGNASGIVTFAYRGESDELQEKLAAVKVIVTNRGEERHVRASVGLHNNRSEVDQLLDVLRDFS